jgi:AraC family transcriptional regulator, regulatory protein of adaptative response / methylated-DNA-[protein]-cysteine methyltransferase
MNLETVSAQGAVMNANGTPPHVDLVRRVCRHIEGNLDGPLTLGALAREAGVDPYRLHRSFKRALGITPRQYADARRLGHLKHRLQGGEDVTTALYAAGYGSSSRLYERAPAHLGMTPATYRQGGRGMRIGYTIVNSPLGRLLVAATSRGLSALMLGENDARLESELARDYPQAEIVRNRNGFAGYVRALLRHLRGQQPHLDLPLDVRATAFQRRVWEELRRIPYGEARTYAQVARAIGKPSAVRAVARACATNHVSVVIPCHRVVGSDGTLTGYRWGVQRKKALLGIEKAAAEKSIGRKSRARRNRASRRDPRVIPAA